MAGAVTVDFWPEEPDELVSAHAGVASDRQQSEKRDGASLGRGTTERLACGTGYERPPKRVQLKDLHGLRSISTLG